MPDLHTQKSPALKDLSDRLSTTLQQNSGHKWGGRGRKTVGATMPLANTIGGEDTDQAKGTTTITIRVTHAEKRELKRLAEAQGNTLTDYLKKRMIQYHRPKTDTPGVNRDTYRTLSNLRRDLLRAVKHIENMAFSEIGPDTPEWAIALREDLGQVRKAVGQLQADLGGDNS